MLNIKNKKSTKNNLYISNKLKIIKIKFKYLIIINQCSSSNLKFLVIKMHHLSLFFRLLIEPEKDMNVALSLCECVEELFIITDGETDDMRICTISVLIDIGL